MSAAIEIKELTVVYNDHSPAAITALDHVSLRVEKGEAVVISGGNGTGKTTLLRAIAGTIPIRSGEIWLDGVNVTHWSARKRTRLLGMVYQDTMLGTCPGLSIQENFQLTDSQRWWLPVPYQLHLSEAQIARMAQAGLGLENRPATLVGSLSGGQRQAMALCMAFEQQKPLLLLDEFTSALDEHTKHRLLQYTFEQAGRQATTLLIVSHRPEELITLNTRIVKF